MTERKSSMLKVYEENYLFDGTTIGSKSFAQALKKITEEINTSEGIYEIIHIENEKRCKAVTVGHNLSNKLVEQIGGKAVVLVDIKDA